VCDKDYDPASAARAPYAAPRHTLCVDPTLHEWLPSVSQSFNAAHVNVLERGWPELGDPIVE